MGLFRRRRARSFSVIPYGTECYMGVGDLVLLCVGKHVTKVAIVYSTNNSIVMVAEASSSVRVVELNEWVKCCTRRKIICASFRRLNLVVTETFRKAVQHAVDVKVGVVYNANKYKNLTTRYKTAEMLFSSEFVADVYMRLGIIVAGWKTNAKEACEYSPKDFAPKAKANSQIPMLSGVKFGQEIVFSTTRVSGGSTIAPGTTSSVNIGKNHTADNVTVQREQANSRKGTLLVDEQIQVQPRVVAPAAAVTWQRRLGHAQI